jgi:hypothetical protein
MIEVNIIIIQFTWISSKKKNENTFQHGENDEKKIYKITILFYYRIQINFSPLSIISNHISSLNEKL